MDITAEFYTALKTKALLENYSQEELNKLSSASILPKARRVSAFLQAAAQVVQSINEGRDFIRSQRQKYTIAGASSNSERDGIEEDIVLLIKACSTRISQLQKTVESEQENPESQITQQGIAHMHGVNLILSEKLKDVAVMFDKYRSMRYHHANEIKQRKERRHARERVRPANQQAIDTPKSEDASQGFSNNGQYQDMKFIEQENKALFDELTTLSQDVQTTEKMVQEIATLNQMFSAQVLSQAEQIEFIYTSAVDASMNIDHGNVQLKKTIKMNTSSRKYVLALLLLCTFGLLFFHWFYS